VKEQTQEVTRQAKRQTRDQLRSQINERSTQAGDQLLSAAEALRRTSEQLRQEGNDKAAEIVESVISRGERAGGYLRAADGDRILHDVERFGRRQPWLMVGGSAVVGFFAARFMKASSSSRYHGQSSQGYPSGPRQGSSVGYLSPAAVTPPPRTAPPVATGNPERLSESVSSLSGEV
jgi:ElaB/YqjD/DUF883 family membrane-anchored ribosome-binding protein